MIPSVGGAIFALLLVCLAAGPLAEKLLGDAGIGWHIRTGDLILRTGSVPRVDPFSSTMQGKPWYAWEWLYDVVLGAVHRVTGLNGVVFLTAFVIAGTFAVVLRRMRARGTGLIVAVGLLLLAVFASSIHFFARPHVVSWLLTVVWFELLRGFEADGKWTRLVWLPLIMLVWVNLHGGFLLGIVLLGIYLLAECAKSLVSHASASREAAGRNAKVLGLVGALTGIITLVNPYGYQLHIHIYRYLTDRFLMDHIDEFLSPNFHGMAQKCFACMVLLTIIGASTALKKVRATELMVIAFAVYSGLYAARNIPVASLLLALVMGPHLSESLNAWSQRPELPGKVRWLLSGPAGFEQRMGTFESSLRGYWLPVVVSLLGIWVCLHQGSLGAKQVMNAHFDAKRFPVQATNWLVKNGVHDLVFCPDFWGGYLIYQQYPELRVMVDDRHDLYGAEYLKKYLKIVRGEPGWDPALNDTHADWVIVPDSSTLAALLREASSWRVVYGDETAVAFKRVTP